MGFILQTLAGDWNTDFQCPCSFTHTVSAFLGELNLSFVDLFSDNVSFSRIPVMMDSLLGLTMLLSPFLSPLWSLLCFNLGWLKPVRLQSPCLFTKSVCYCCGMSMHVQHTNLLQFLGLRPPPHSLVSLRSRMSDDVISCCNPLCTFLPNSA